MADLQGILADLDAETGSLDRLVAELSPEAWRTPTPAAGWTIAHQISHLAWTDEVASLAARDAEAFGAVVRRALEQPDAIDAAADEGAALESASLLERWRTQRAALAEALLAVPAGRKLPWFGPPMSAASMATARTMETWAHAQDVTDALGVEHPPGAALRQVAYLGVRTRDFAYVLHDRTPPPEPFRIELHAPDGELWTWGPDDAAQLVTGPAVDFCLLVTQRRHRADLALTATGTDADAWLDIAQAFAGPPGGGRAATNGPRQ
jgi:uncharacterized protein (TIGR03084 family)